MITTVVFIFEIMNRSFLQCTLQQYSQVAATRMTGGLHVGNRHVMAARTSRNLCRKRSRILIKCRVEVHLQRTASYRILLAAFPQFVGEHCDSSVALPRDCSHVTGWQSARHLEPRKISKRRRDAVKR